MALRETAMTAPLDQQGEPLGAPAPVRSSMFFRRTGKMYHILPLRHDMGFDSLTRAVNGRPGGVQGYSVIETV